MTSCQPSEGAGLSAVWADCAVGTVPRVEVLIWVPLSVPFLTLAGGDRFLLDFRCCHRVLLQLLRADRVVAEVAGGERRLRR